MMFRTLFARTCLLLIFALLVPGAASPVAAQDKFSTASAINNRGDIAGGSTISSPVTPFVTWVIGKHTSTTIGTFGGPASLAYGSNDRGDVVLVS
jgi:uncharacterized membrane protein